MAVEMYLIQPKDTETDSVRESIAEFVAQRGGFILMATSGGSLIVALDQGHLESVKANDLVAFASGVTLNPNAPGAAVLQRMFCENVAAQLVERRTVQPARDHIEESSTGMAFPPGYRPIRWPTSTNSVNRQGGG